MLFLNLVKLLLLLGGPIVGYHIAMRQPVRRRWKVIASCAAGGVVAAVMLVSILVITELSEFATARDLARAALPVVAEYALFGLVLGFAAMLIPAASRRRFFIIGLAIVGLVSVFLVVKDVGATRLAEQSTPGIVFGPGNVPAAGAPVFVDRGFGSVDKVTTDTAGQFRALLKLRRNRQATLLICVPGGTPKIARPLENVVTVYQVTALPPHWGVRSHLREEGWLPPIPRECLAGAATP